MLKVLVFIISFSSYAELRESFSDWPSTDKFAYAFDHSSSLNQFRIPLSLGILSLLIDGEISDKASKHNYLYGSQENAQNWSDSLLLGLIPFMLYTTTQTNVSLASGENIYQRKAEFMGVEFGILLTDFIIIMVSKRLVRRTRPDGTDTESLPSGHSSVSAGLSRMVYNNIENSDYKNTTYGNFLQATALTMSSLVAWGRVEGKKHHLSDVFLGHAFGAFISDFLYVSFLEKRPALQTSLFVSPQSQSLNLSMSF